MTSSAYQPLVRGVLEAKSMSVSCCELCLKLQIRKRYADVNMY